MEGSMGKEWPARSFKSGNSTAIRMPAALGIEPNRDWTVTERDGEFVFRPKPIAGSKIDLTGIYGSAPGLRHVARMELRPASRDGETGQP
jgi:antitoxin VapB